MDFYKLAYLKSQHQVDQVVVYVIAIIVLIFTTLTLITYTKNRWDTKYRDLSIIMLLIILFLFGLNYNGLEQHKSQNLSSSQIQPFIKSVAREENVSVDKIAVNSKILSDGIIVKVEQKFYRVALSADRSSYNLERTHMIDQKINVQ